ncbi:MAG: DUF2959 domain-containing protein [Gammaproteobacteria bacterium]
MRFIQNALFLALFTMLSACSSLYYKGLEEIGIPKREVMIYRVEKARSTQEETKKQFKSALEQFTAMTNFQGGDLEATYNKLNGEYEASVKKAEEINKRINDVEDVSEALFEEWETELDQYTNASLRRNSQEKMIATEAHYKNLIDAMKRAEAKIEPVLSVFRDQVLYLKHNLNAQAIASLKGQLGMVEADVASLVAAMEESITEANNFIKTIGRQ